VDGRTFYFKIDDHRELNWLTTEEGDTPAEDFVLIGNKQLHTTFALPIASIKEHSWNDLEAVLTVKRPPQIMKHMTRIVGYYSELQNWNPSKIAELKDRHKGNYSVPEGGQRLQVPELVA